MVAANHVYENTSAQVSFRAPLSPSPLVQTRAFRASSPFFHPTITLTSISLALTGISDTTYDSKSWPCLVHRMTAETIREFPRRRRRKVRALRLRGRSSSTWVSLHNTFADDRPRIRGYRCHWGRRVRRRDIGTAPIIRNQGCHQEDCAVRSLHVRIEDTEGVEAAQILCGGGCQRECE